MSLDNVISEIEDEANKRKEEILAEAKAEIDNALDVERQKQYKLNEQNKKETSKTVSMLKQRELSSLELQMKKDTLNARKEIMAKIQEIATEKISNLQDNEKLLKLLIQQAKKELPDAKYIYSNSEDKKIVESIAGSLKFKSTIDCLGGVILADSSEAVRVNYTYDVILQNVFQENMHGIYRRVFGK